MTFDMTIDLGPVQSDEIVSRYVMSSRYIRQNGTVKGQIFQDTRKPAEISVVRTNSLTNDEIWAIGSKYFVKPILGRADIIAAKAEAIRFLEDLDQDSLQNLESDGDDHKLSEIRVKLIAAPNPHPYHANITYTPPRLAYMKHIAKHLARRSDFHPAA